ncbi:MAG TPA: single-stranded-DNA-specific exonuclease RecJ [Gemmatimonadales bacterium]|nr:single-stranded-DNA-specific exonuclease RecJ [Gemmatimonadales bacterium]
MSAAATLPLRWVVCPPPEAAAVRRLAEALSLPLPLAAILAQRGYGEPEAARHFLRPQLETLASPRSLAGMPAAVDLIAATVRANRPILVHGDYDVDGQCAAALLARVLRVAGARVTAFVPHRLRDGYDFGPAGLERARAIGAGLIVTCDCGITAVEAVRGARDAGIAVVVTDHHLPGPDLPPADAVIDPQQPGDRSGLTGLCGTGIAFKLAQALVPALGLPAHLPLHLLDLVALATVADVVPLTGENRVLVKHGLKLLGASRWPGVRALLDACGLAGKPVRAGHCGFILGPRLNAAGRIGDAADGLRLLLTDDPAEAAALARRLEQLNGERQQLDQRMLEQALDRVERAGELDAGIVLHGEDWHPGVVGIVASRVVERFGRPTFLIAFDGEIGRGSGRSISRFDLHAALTECRDLLERFGGHQMAAGLTIRRGRLEEFRERFATVVRRSLGPDELGPEQRVDLEIPLREATADLERLARYLEPCGAGNPAPVLAVRGVRLTRRSIVGGGHLKGMLEDADAQLAAIGFQWAERAAGLGEGPVDAAFRLERNEWQGLATLQARLCTLAPHAPPN